jgi:nitrogen fixation protein FixH
VRQNVELICIYQSSSLPGYVNHPWRGFQGVIGFDVGHPNIGLPGTVIVGPSTSNTLPQLDGLGLLSLLWSALALCALLFWSGLLLVGLAVSRWQLLPAHLWTQIEQRIRSVQALALVVVLCAASMAFFAPPIIFPPQSVTTRSNTAPVQGSMNQVQARQVGDLLVTLQVLPGRVNVANTMLVTLSRADGTLVTNAHVQLTTNMVIMNMGTSQATMTEGTPSYVASFGKAKAFAMEGFWFVDVRIERPPHEQPALSSETSQHLADATVSAEAGVGDAPVFKRREQQLARRVRLREQRLEAVVRRFTRALMFEPLVGVAILLCVGLMNVYAGTLTPLPAPPPASTAVVAKPAQFNARTTDGLFSVHLTVDPNRFGLNTFTVKVIDVKTGQPVTNAGVSVYTTMIDMDMGTETVNLQPDGQGAFRASGDLGMAGHWQLRVVVRTLDNHLHPAVIKLVTPA